MRRFIITFIVVVLLAGTAFVFGYVPFRVDAGSVGVLWSKTSGWDTTVIVGGRFVWRWQLLIPRNTTVYTLPREPRRMDLRAKVAAPSAALYADYVDAPLESHIELRIRYLLTPEAIVELVPLGLRPESIEAWYRDIEDRIRSVALAALTSTEQPLPASASQIGSRVRARLDDEFPQLEVQAVIPVRIDLVDPLVVETARATFEAVQAAREAALIAEAAAFASLTNAAEQRIETLRGYAQLLDEHPVLLDYLRIVAEVGTDPLNAALPPLEAASGGRATTR